MVSKLVENISYYLSISMISFILFVVCGSFIYFLWYEYGSYIKFKCNNMNIFGEKKRYNIDSDDDNMRTKLVITVPQWKQYIINKKKRTTSNNIIMDNSIIEENNACDSDDNDDNNDNNDNNMSINYLI